MTDKNDAVKIKCSCNNSDVMSHDETYDSLDSVYKSLSLQTDALDAFDTSDVLNASSTGLLISNPNGSINFGTMTWKPLNRKKMEYATNLMDMSLAAPPNVAIPMDAHLSERDIGTVSGVEADYESSFDSETYSEVDKKLGKKNWSAVETVQLMVQQNGENINRDIFQIFINEMVKNKCWDEQDVYEFNNNMAIIAELMDNTLNDTLDGTTYSDNKNMIDLLLNPRYYNAIHNVLDKLDTINTMCILGTGDKCNMIADVTQREIIKQQVRLIGDIVRIYMPIFIRLVLLIEHISIKLTDDNVCNLDPIYIETIKKIKEHLIGTLYMHKLGNKSFEKQNMILKQMSNNDNVPKPFNDVVYDRGAHTMYGLNDTTIEPFYVNDGDCAVTIIVIVILCIFLYFFINK